MRDGENTLWVVYQTVSTPRQPARNAVCTQAEWEEKERAGPGLNTLIREGISNEGVAERLARDLQTPPVLPRSARGRAAPPVPAHDAAPPAPSAG
jgi:hypothetical protein